MVPVTEADCNSRCDFEAEVAAADGSVASAHREVFFTVEGIDGALTFMRRLFSHVGGHQGCVIATRLTVKTYHEKVCRPLARANPDVLVIGDADDTLTFGRTSHLFKAFDEAMELQGGIGLVSTLRKVTYHAPTGDYSDVPDKYKQIISPNGYKSLGVWRGPRDERRKVLGEMMTKKLANLDNIDGLHNTEKVNNAAQLQLQLINIGASIPEYWAQQLRPSDTRVAMAAADAHVWRRASSA